MNTTETFPRSDRPVPGAHRAERPAATLRVLRLSRAVARWLYGPAATPATEVAAPRPVIDLQEEAA